MQTPQHPRPKHRAEAQAPTPPDKHGGHAKASPSKSRQPILQMRSQQSLERLGNRVQETAQALEQLREANTHLQEANHALHERLNALQESGGASEGQIRLQIDEDPDALRHKVQGFIDTLDQYLTQGRKPS